MAFSTRTDLLFFPILPQVFPGVRRNSFSIFGGAAGFISDTVIVVLPVAYLCKTISISEVPFVITFPLEFFLTVNPIGSNGS